MAAPYFLKRGFTLVELLIAMSIMLAMLVLAGTAYQLYTASWQRDLSKIQQSYQDFRYTELLLDAMQGILPLAVTDDGRQAYYFLGREEGFTAVSYSPIFNSGFPAVIRVFREANASGGYRLVYEEASLQQVVLSSAAQNLPFSQRQIIYNEISDLTFSYYGWKDIATRMAAVGDVDVSIKNAPAWSEQYDALNRRLHPEKIRIQLGEFALEFAIPDRSRLNISREDAENPV